MGKKRHSAALPSPAPSQKCGLPPDYEPPSEAEELVQDQDIVPTILLRDQGNGQYAATFPGFDQMGSYRIVIYAEDNDNYEGRPLSFLVQTGHQLYLPTVMR